MADDDERLIDILKDAIDFESMASQSEADWNQSTPLTAEALYDFIEKLRDQYAYNMVAMPHPSEEETFLERLEAMGLVGVKIVPCSIVDPGTVYVITPAGLEAAENPPPIQFDFVAEYHTPWSVWQIPMAYGMQDVWKITGLNT